MDYANHPLADVPGFVQYAQQRDAKVDLQRLTTPVDGTVSVMSTLTPNLDPTDFRNLKHIGSVWSHAGSGVHSLGAYNYFQEPPTDPGNPPVDVATGLGMYSSNDDGSQYAELSMTPGNIRIKATEKATITGITHWESDSILTVGKAESLYATAKIPDYKANHSYSLGDTIYYEGHIWRALKHGNLVAPDKPQGTAIVYFNAPGYSKNPYRITSVTNAAPVGVPHTPFDMHLEYVSDLNFHLYKPNGPVWQKITGITLKTWFSEGVPAIPYPNHATIWIYSAPGTHATPIAGQNDWTSLKFNEFLSGLSDVDFEDQPRGGQSLVYNDAMHRWINGTPAFKLPDHLTSVHYQHGDTVYYQGQFWRNILTTTTNFNNVPQMTPNGAVGFFRHGGVVIGPIMAEFVEVGDPTVAPTGHVDKPLGKHYALKWQDDNHWSAWEWAVISHGPTVWGWKQITLAHHKTWRNFALPAPVTEEDTGQLWIYAAPGTTTPPVVPQKYWEPVPLGDFLVSLADVDAINAQANDTLVYNGHGKWVAQALTGGGGGVSQSYVDTLMNTTVSGLGNDTRVKITIPGFPGTPRPNDVQVPGIDTAISAVFNTLHDHGTRVDNLETTVSGMTLQLPTSMIVKYPGNTPCVLQDAFTQISSSFGNLTGGGGGGGSYVPIQSPTRVDVVNNERMTLSYIIDGPLGPISATIDIGPFNDTDPNDTAIKIHAGGPTLVINAAGAMIIQTSGQHDPILTQYAGDAKYLPQSLSDGATSGDVLTWEWDDGVGHAKWVMKAPATGGGGGTSVPSYMSHITEVNCAGSVNLTLGNNTRILIVNIIAGEDLGIVFNNQLQDGEAIDITLIVVIKANQPHIRFTTHTVQGGSDMYSVNGHSHLGFRLIQTNAFSWVFPLGNHA